MTIRKRLLAGLVAASLLGVGGCWFLVGAGVGAGALAAYQYVRGEGTKVYARDVDDVRDAAETALRQMDIIVINSSHDKLQGEVNGRLRDDTAVSVRLKAESPHATQVKVRIGTFGDETRTQMVFQEIDKQLDVQTTPPAPVP